MLLRLGQPHLGVRHRRAAGEIGCLRVARRVHQALNVPGVAQHERTGTAEQLGGAITTGPRSQVVGGGAGYERWQPGAIGRHKIDLSAFDIGSYRRLLAPQFCPLTKGFS